MWEREDNDIQKFIKAAKHCSVPGSKSRGNQASIHGDDDAASAQGVDQKHSAHTPLGPIAGSSIAKWMADSPRPACRRSIPLRWYPYSCKEVNTQLATCTSRPKNKKLALVPNPRRVAFWIAHHINNNNTAQTFLPRDKRAGGMTV